MTMSRPVRFRPDDGPLGNTCAVVLGDFQKLVGPEFMDIVDVLFAHFGSLPVEAIAEYDAEKSIGSYSRVRSRIRNFLQSVAAGRSDRLNISIGNHARRKDPTFHHGSAEAALGTRLDQSCVLFGVDELRAGKRDEFVEFTATQLFKLVGPCYGYYLAYPKHHGVGYYVASVISIPQGGNVMAYKEYGARVTRWRDRKWAGLRASQGYIREVYEINFLLESHLQAPVNGVPLRKVAEELGELVAFPPCPGVYKWTIPTANLELARDQFEDSGLVLSAPAEPIPL